jgi:hypothetical protein
VGAVQLKLIELEVVAVTVSAVGAAVTAAQEAAEVLSLMIVEAAEVP